MLRLQKVPQKLLKENIFKNTVKYYGIAIPGEHKKIVEEIKIPVPWGHIVGKWWGSQDKQPMLCTHGRRDNCGTFDRLMPLLSNDRSFLTIDFPGHGKSSHFPKGYVYHIGDAVITLKRIQDHFQWKTMSMMGHSFGAQINFLYSVIFSDEIDYLINIDTLKPPGGNPGYYIDEQARNIDKFLDLDMANIKRKDYTYDELFKQYQDRYKNKINRENIKYILDRSIEISPENGEKYFSTDDVQFEVNSIIGMNQTDLLEYVKKILVPFLMIKVNGTGYGEDPKNYYESLEILKNNNRKFEYHAVDGTHYMHLNNPEIIAPIINDFLDRYDRKQ